MKIGFFGGCFNPPTNVHIDIAKELINDNIVDKVIFVPIGDFYKKQELVSIDKRCMMLKLATKYIENVAVDDFEKDIKNTIFAADAFRIISNNYKQHQIYFIMGSDNFLKMSSWKEYHDIINSYNYIVVERDGNKIIEERKNVIFYYPKKEYNYDSTLVRKLIKKRKNIDNMINLEVKKYIETNELYIKL